MVDELLVSRKVLGGTEVGGGKDLAVGADLDVLARADPRLPGSVGKLASLGGAAVSELVGSVVKGDKDGRPGSVEGNKGGDLVAAGGSNETSLLGPDSHHGSDGPVVVNDGGSIQGVPAHGELSVAALVNIADDGVLLGGTLTDDGGLLDGLPDEVVGNDLLRELKMKNKSQKRVECVEQGEGHCEEMKVQGHGPRSFDTVSNDCSSIMEGEERKRAMTAITTTTTRRLVADDANHPFSGRNLHQH